MGKKQVWECDQCGQLLKGYEIPEHICKPARIKYYLIGIMPEDSPDHRYWLDRFEWIPAVTEVEAKEKWEVLRQGWLTDDEVFYIKVWATRDFDEYNPSKKYSTMQEVMESIGVKKNG
jgi:hypothetical protein